VAALGWISLFHQKRGPGTARHQRVLALDRFLFGLLFILIAHFIAVSYVRPHLQSAVLGLQSHLSQQLIVDGVNTQREKNGIEKLQWSEKLTQAAQKKGDDMIARDYWSHISPTGSEPWDFLDQVGYSYSVAGENLARNFSENQSLVDAWMASPTHRANVLQAQYQEVGVAVVQGKDTQANKVVVVAMFGTQATTPIAEVSRNAVQTSPIVTGELDSKSHILGRTTVLQSVDYYRLGTLAVLIGLIILLFLDVWKAHHQKLPRSVNKIVAHILLLLAVVLTILAAEGTAFF
jgi:hypothetical protein